LGDQCLAIRTPGSADEILLLFRRTVTAGSANFALVAKNGVPLQILKLLTSGSRDFAKEDILDAVGYTGTDHENYLRRQVSDLRERLGDDIEDPIFIVNIRGFGYGLVMLADKFDDGNGQREWTQRGFGPLPEMLAEVADNNSVDQPTRHLHGVPAFGRLFGREDEIEAALSRWPTDIPTALLIWGAPGIGKSALALRLLNDPRTIQQFKERRFWFRCDGRESAEDLKQYIASKWFGLTPAGEHDASGALTSVPLEGQVWRRLSEAPAACVIDNFETLHKNDPVESVNFLRVLCGLPNVWVIVTRHGRVPPGGINWSAPIEPTALSPTDAMAMFCNIGDNWRHLDDTRLPALLDDLAGIPRAIELLAHQAIGADLGILVRRWQDQGTLILKRLSNDKREDSLPRTYDFVLEHLSEDARHMLRLLACLPIGILEDEIGDAFGGPSAFDSAQELIQMAIVSRESGRLRLSPLLRDYVSRRYPAIHADTAPIRRHFMGVAFALHDLSSDRGPARVEETEEFLQGPLARLSDEFPNVTWAVGQSLEMGEATWFDPLETPIKTTLADSILPNGAQRLKARRIERAFRSKIAVADASVCLGRFSLSHDNLEKAEAYFDAAKKIYEAMTDWHGKGTCLFELEEIKRYRGQSVSADAYHEVKDIFTFTGDRLGVFDCLCRIGDIKRDEKDYAWARECFEEALSIARAEDYASAEADAIAGLSELAIDLKQYDIAGTLLQDARRLFTGAKDRPGLSRIDIGFIKLALLQGDYSAAATRGKETLEELRTIGDKWNEAVCLLLLGHNASECDELDDAVAHYKQAVETGRLVGNVDAAFDATVRLSVIYLARKLPSEAAIWIREAEEGLRRLSSRRQNGDARARLALQLGEIALDQDDRAGAEDHYQKALSLFENERDQEQTIHCIIGLGDVATRRTHWGEAKAFYEQAMKISQEIGDRRREVICTQRLDDLAARTA